MRKMGIKIGIVILVLIVVSAFGVNKYLTATTIFQYGTIPNDAIPENIEEVTYTIPTIDEEGKRGTQTFTVKHQVENGKIVKLSVRNDKVKKHEFVGEKDVPEKIRQNLPTNNF